MTINHFSDAGLFRVLFDLTGAEPLRLNHFYLLINTLSLNSLINLTYFICVCTLIFHF